MRRLSEYGSVAYLVERPTRETQVEQYSDNALSNPMLADYEFIDITVRAEAKGHFWPGVVFAKGCEFLLVSLVGVGFGVAKSGALF